jgi:sugar fermentation stimulation protein A
VEIEGQEEKVHVKNTGRCKELLIPGCNVYLAVSDNSERKTKYDLIATEKVLDDGRTILINMDSQVPNDVAEEWLAECGMFSSSAIIKREVTFGKSRFDFYIEDGERKAFLEVKGCTLEKDGVAMFPDAPTERGVKHINELRECIDKGYESYILFIIQMKDVKEFRPNDETHKEFGDALRKAYHSGVKIIAMNCNVTPEGLTVSDEIFVKL